jgi:DNA mismatch endonuclease, patch repair protein
LADIFSQEKRSQIMASVKNKATKPEIKIRKALFIRGFRYKINDKNLPGSPDIVLPKYQAAIFVHGCFWHGHINCTKSINPKSNISFWKNKIALNMNRDTLIKEQLSKLGWKVLTIWECELRNKTLFNKLINRTVTALKQK